MVEENYKNRKFAREGDPNICFLKNIITSPNIIVGDYTFYHDFENPLDFERKNVLYHYPLNNDKLIIGKYCSIANGAKFLFNGANHDLKSISTYPFPIFYDKWESGKKVQDAWDNKGDIIIGDDVWIGFEAMIYAGVTIGSGAIIASRAVVSKDVEPYSIVGGLPAKEIRKRFDAPQIEFLLKLKWWDWSEEKINKNLQYIINSDFETLQAIFNEKVE